jgi:hypothetical protein
VFACPVTDARLSSQLLVTASLSGLDKNAGWSGGSRRGAVVVLERHIRRGDILSTAAECSGKWPSSCVFTFPVTDAHLSLQLLVTASLSGQDKNAGWSGGSRRGAVVVLEWMNGSCNECACVE